MDAELKEKEGLTRQRGKERCSKQRETMSKLLLMTRGAGGCSSETEEREA